MSNDGKTVEGQIVQQGVVASGGDYLAELDRMNNVIERVVNAAIKATHSGQWCDMQGKPYLTGPGAEVVALRCAVSWKNVTSRKEWREDEGGRSYLYIYEADFTLGHGPFAHTIEAIPGTCSSRDQFLGTNFKDGKDLKSLSEVEEGSIMKGAMTNMIINGVTRVTGIRNMTWEQLKALGIDQGGAAKIDYASGSKGGGQGKPAVFPYGDNKDLAPSDPKVADKDLTWWATRLAEDLTKPDKAKFKAGNEKLLAAIKTEQAKRANEKAGTAAKPSDAPPSLWERLKQLATAQGVPEDKLKALTKAALKKEAVNPAELTEAEFKLVADAVGAAAAEAEKTKGAAGF